MIFNSRRDQWQNIVAVLTDSDIPGAEQAVAVINRQLRGLGHPKSDDRISVITDDDEIITTIYHAKDRLTEQPPIA